MHTFASLFTGFGLADIGAHQAGLSPLWGIELDPDLASVAVQNGIHTQVRDVCDVEYEGMESPWWLHASPPCTTASVANSNGGENELDMELAAAVIRAIDALNPACFSLENVYGYRKYEAFKSINAALFRNGYQVAAWHLNAADYGVPQTRKRLILVASRVARPRKPRPTHTGLEDQAGQFSLFDSPVLPWVGWYEAIADLIPTLPESQFAQWQLNKLPDEITTMLVNEDSKVGTVNSEARSFTVVASPRSGNIRALLVPGGNATSFSTREGHEPSRVIGDTERVGHIPRALLVDGKLGSYSTILTTRDGHTPSMTVTTSHNNRDQKAVIVESDNRPRFERIEEEYRNHRDYRRTEPPHALRVVKMTPRVLARFQSVPDWYALPESASLAVKGIGNAVPPLLMQRVIEAQS